MAQRESGVVLNKQTNSAVPYANISIAGRNIGTVADGNGSYSFEIDNKFNKDSIKFSCVGFYPYSILVSDYKHLGNKTIYLEEKVITTANPSKIPASYKTKTFGSFGTTGFVEVNGGVPGSEAGVLFYFKDNAALQRLLLKIDTCSVDTLFFRVNVYKKTGDKQFTNILTRPVYISSAASAITDKNLSVDLSEENLVVKGNYLVTVQQIRSVPGSVVKFTGKKPGTTYARRASFNKWNLIPTGMSMKVEAKTGF